MFMIHTRLLSLHWLLSYLHRMIFAFQLPRSTASPSFNSTSSRYLSTTSFQFFLGLPLCLAPHPQSLCMCHPIFSHVPFHNLCHNAKQDNLSLNLSLHVHLIILISIVATLLCLCRHRAETLSDAFVWRLSVWCLSHSSGITREQRGLGRLKLA